MAPTRGYHSYRGRTPRGTIVLAVLLVVVILAALAVIALQRYVVYDENGEPYLDLPGREEEAPAPPPDAELDLTIQAQKRPDAMDAR